MTPDYQPPITNQLEVQAARIDALERYLERTLEELSRLIDVVQHLRNDVDDLSTEIRARTGEPP